MSRQPLSRARHRRPAIADPTLALPGRAGLPPEIAYLRDTYPVAGWRAHANYGELAAFWLQVHESLRTDSTALRGLVDGLRGGGDAAAFGAVFVPRFNHFLQHLTMHHRIEDSAYFPKCRALDPRMVAGFDLLEADHHVVDAALHATLASARRLMAALDADDWRAAADAHAADAERLAALLTRHLGDEEELVIPAILAHGERSLA